MEDALPIDTFLDPGIDDDSDVEEPKVEEKGIVSF